MENKEEGRLKQRTASIEYGSIKTDIYQSLAFILSPHLEKASSTIDYYLALCIIHVVQSVHQERWLMMTI